MSAVRRIVETGRIPTRYRSPEACSSRRTATSGCVFFDLLPCIERRTAGDEAHELPDFDPELRSRTESPAPCKPEDCKGSPCELMAAPSMRHEGDIGLGSAHTPRVRSHVHPRSQFSMDATSYASPRVWRPYVDPNEPAQSAHLSVARASTVYLSCPLSGCTSTAHGKAPMDHTEAVAELDGLLKTRRPYRSRVGHWRRWRARPCQLPAGETGAS
jgi:hypothetical protein